jgi:hypothetical protein
MEQFEIEHITITQSVNNFTALYSRKYPLPYTQSALPNCLEPDESTPHFIRL